MLWFVGYPYDKPEYVINYNKKNAPLMKPYRMEEFFNKVMLDLSKLASVADEASVEKLSEEEQKTKDILK